METIVVQDLDESIVNIITIALEIEGFIVMRIHGLSDNILKFISNSEPNLVLIDYGLTGVEAINTCSLIAQKFPGLPVIIMSCDLGIRDKYQKDGFMDCLDKPFDLDILYKTIRRNLPKLGY